MFMDQRFASVATLDIIYRPILVTSMFVPVLTEMGRLERVAQIMVMQFVQVVISVTV